MVEAKVHNIRIKMSSYQRLVQIQGILQLRDKKMYNMADVVEEVLRHYPDLEVPIDGKELRLVEEIVEEDPCPKKPRK